MPTTIKTPGISLQAYGNSLLSGCFFGFALAFAGVTSPAIIIKQLNLTSFHMLKVFISASATSAYVFSFASLSLSLPLTHTLYSLPSTCQQSC